VIAPPLNASVRHVTFVLTVTASASAALTQVLEQAGVTPAAISFSQSSESNFDDGLIHEVGPNPSDLALRECGLSADRSKLVPVRWLLEAKVLSREKVPPTDQVEVHGFCLAFSPSQQDLMTGGVLDYRYGSFSVTDATGSVVLPLHIERYTNARA
jgi:hypothetical protein